MRFDLDKAFGIHQYALQLRSQRAEILASNLANADTPGYKARDMDFHAALNSIMQEVKNNDWRPARIAENADGAGASVKDFANIMYRQIYQPSLDGNSVDTEVEKAQFSRNAVDYQVSLRFLSGKIRSLTTALKGE